MHKYFNMPPHRENVFLEKSYDAALSRKPERVCGEVTAVEVLRAERALARLL